MRTALVSVGILLAVGGGLGLATDEVRLPIVAASETARAKVREAMAHAGVLKA